MKGVIEKIVWNALDEDLSRGDLTTDACIPPGLFGAADFRAREKMVMAMTIFSRARKSAAPKRPGGIQASVVRSPRDKSSSRAFQTIFSITPFMRHLYPFINY